MRYMKAKPNRKRGATRGLADYSSIRAQPESPSIKKSVKKSPIKAPSKPQHTEEGLLKLTNSKLRDILSGFEGAPSGVGNTKSELVALILDAQG